MSPREPDARTAQLNVRLSQDEIDGLRKMAEKTGVTGSEFTRHAIRLAIGMPSILTGISSGVVELPQERSNEELEMLRRAAQNPIRSPVTGDHVPNVVPVRASGVIAEMRPDGVPRPEPSVYERGRRSLEAPKPKRKR